MFFVISGYLITTNADRRWTALGTIGARAVFGLRVARIVPCLLLMLVAVNAFASPGVAIFQNHSPAGTPVSIWLVNLASLIFWINVLLQVGRAFCPWEGTIRIMWLIANSIQPIGL